MTSELGFLTFVGFLGAAQALVVGAALLTVGEPRTRLLGPLLAGLGLAMGSITLAHSGLVTRTLYLELFEYTLALALAPLFYLYVVRILDGESRLGRRAWLHFLPAALWVLYVGAIFLELAIIDERILPRWMPPILAIVVYQTSYTGLAAWRSFGPPARRREAPPGALKYARTLIVFFAVIHLAQFLRFLLRGRGEFRDIVPIASTLLVFGVTFAALRHSRLFTGLGSDESADAPRRKYEGSTLSPERAEQVWKRLLELMETDQPHLRGDLTLAELAGQLSLPKTHLSQLINERHGHGFLAFLTDYRVAEAERLLLSTSARHLTIEAVSGRSGFRSRSAFYEAFKRKTGLTPAAYQKERAGRDPDAPSGSGSAAC